MQSVGGLYIHVPFCHSRCYYCDFFSSADAPGELKERYLHRVMEEIDSRAPQGLDTPFNTIYIGGGTPSSLPLPLLGRLIDSLNTTACREFTIEVNPEDVNEQLCKLLTSIPHRRVSIGVQSLVDGELQGVGRRHSAATAINASRLLRSHGIDNISLDLIYGLPGQTLSSFDTSLKGVIDLQPTHLSAYLLSYEPHSRLTLMRDRGSVTEATAEEACRYYDHLCKVTAQAGYEHYEISNFALPGYYSRHNSSYWDGSPYLGVGPGAHSYDGFRRSFNTPMLKRYLDGGYTATLTPDDDNNPQSALNDMIITALRTARGLSLTSVAERYGTSAVDRLIKDASAAIVAGTLIHDGDRLVIPECHWLITDSILIQLIQ